MFVATGGASCTGALHLKHNIICKLYLQVLGQATNKLLSFFNALKLRYTPSHSELKTLPEQFAKNFC